MTMYKDYLRFNKLGVFLVSLGFVFVTFISALFLILLKYAAVTNLLWSTFIWNKVITLLLFLILLIICLTSLGLLVNALATFFGKSRNLIMMHRGRSYYLKFQLITITISSLIISLMLILWSYLDSLIFIVGDLVLTEFPPIKIVSKEINYIAPMIGFVLIIIVYYFLVYLIDIFVNSEYRYHQLAKRNLAILKFILRCAVIAGSGFYIYLTVIDYRLNFNSSVAKLVTQPYNNHSLLLVILLIAIAVVLVVDYIEYFKKKVLV